MPKLDAMNVNITPQRAMCDFHAEPFKMRWPLGVGLITERLWNAAINTVPPYEGRESFDEYTKAHCRHVERHLDIQPLCCRLESINKIHLINAYATIEIFPDGICNYCNKLRSGWLLPMRRANKSHLCFECYFDRRNH